MSAFADLDFTDVIDSSSQFDQSNWFYFFATILFWIFNATIGCCFMERDSDAWIYEDRPASKTVPTRVAIPVILMTVCHFWSSPVMKYFERK